MTNRHSFELADDAGIMSFNIFDDGRKEMLHINSNFTCSQLHLKMFGIQIVKQKENTKLAFWFKGGVDYTSLYFKPVEYNPLVRYFRSLGYPVPEEKNPDVE